MPGAIPDHIVRAQEEDIEFLTSNGVTLEEALRRVGLQRKTYEKRHQPSRQEKRA